MAEVTVNTITQTVTFPTVPGSSWSNWSTIDVPINMNAGSNTVVISSTDGVAPNVDQISVTA